MLYVGLGIIYLFLLVYFGVKCFKNSRWVLLVLGVFFPIFWIIGGVLPRRDVESRQPLRTARTVRLGRRVTASISAPDAEHQPPGLRRGS